MLTSTLFTTGLLVVASASPVFKRSVTGPLLEVDFPDPAAIQDGNRWYIFGSQSQYNNTEIKVQLATSSDLGSWELQQGYDALSNLPSWAVNDGKVWGPDVVKLSDGSYLLYFGATSAKDTTKHCVGTARSKTVRGPYVADDEPFDCQLAQGGSLDASGFVDTDGKRYVTWKIDANSLGNGGSCNNGIAPIKTTPILVQQVQADGRTKIGSATTILTNSPIDGPLVEGPAIIKRGSQYILFFSNNCFSSPLYTQSYATSNDIHGPYTKAARPLYTQGDYGLIGPGGGTPTLPDGSRLVFHALVGTTGLRYPHVGYLSYNLSYGTNVITG